jgi:2-polyprenyl-6-methoxyphenol hydroxylase-like FAD-dependent oxidoreductase
VHRRPGNAVVIGGGLAGLVTARVLSEHFEQVTLLERDRYPGQPEIRAGVPQGSQIHILLARGREVLGRLFPTLDAALVAGGAPEHDVLQGWWVRFAAGPLVRCTSGCRIRTVSRIRLEHEVRHLVAAIGNVQVIENAEVTGLLAERGQATGVALRPKRPGDGDVPGTVAGTLVVDASGRGSKAPQWLSALGYPAPTATVVDGRLSYATRPYEGVRLPSDCPGGLLVGSHAPGIPRCGGVIRIEGGRYMALLANIGGEPAPTEAKAYLAFARTLPSEAIYEAIRDATPIGPARGYGRTENQWRHYERLDRRLEGFIPLGDALCTFNPFYGQGMTVAALEAVALGEEVERGPQALVGRALRRFCTIIKGAWQFATSEDYRWPTTEGGRRGVAERFGTAYVDQVTEVATRDPKVATTLIHVIHMNLPATALFRPHVLAPVLGRVLRGKKPAQSAP